MPIIKYSDVGRPLTISEGDENFGELDARTRLGWRDNIVPFDVEAGNPNSPVLNVFRGNIKRYTFFAGQMTEASAVWHVDHDYALGTKLYPHVHWSVVGNALGTVRWGFEITVARGHQQEAFGAPFTVYVEQSSLGVSYMHYVAEVSEANAIDGALLNIEPDTLIMARCFRDGAHPNDTLDADVFGLCLDLHYQADKATTLNKAPNFFGA